jgi:hypothetical protein
MVPKRVPEAWGLGNTFTGMGGGDVLFEAGTVGLWVMMNLRLSYRMDS